MKKLMLITLLMIISIRANACYMAPKAQTSPPEILIQRTATITIATVIEKTNNTVGTGITYKFKTLKTLKGKISDFFELATTGSHSQSQDEHFNHHSDRRFWQNNSGRLRNFIDCEIYPNFSVGSTYLVFLEKPYHNKSFELIMDYGNGKDAWLEYVKEAINRVN